MNYLYQKMKKDLMTLDKETLVTKVIALTEIESSDRGFANRSCETSINSSMDELFSEIASLKETIDALESSENLPNDIKDAITTVKKAEKTLRSKTEIAKESWDYIKDGLNDMNDSSRVRKTTADIKIKID